jgi:hypothetical protein
MKAAAILMLAGALTACNVQAKHDGDKNDTVRISASDADGNVSFDVPFAKGEVKLPGGAIHGGDIDIDGVKMYPGATVTGLNVNAADKNSVVNIGFKAPAPPQKVRDYYMSEFKKKGVEASASGDGVSGKSKDGDQFEIHVQPLGGGSQGSVTIHSDDD